MRKAVLLAGLLLLIGCEVKTSAPVTGLAPTKDWEAWRSLGLPRSCAVEARAYQLLHSAGCWTRLVRLEYGQSDEAHAVCVYALANADIWVYDVNTGSQKIQTRSHSLGDITKALGLIYDRIRRSCFIDGQ